MSWTPHIKSWSSSALFQKKEDLLQARTEAEEALRSQAIELSDPSVVRAYVEDLKQLLEEFGVVEQKAFLESFVERIEVGESETKVIYTIPSRRTKCPRRRLEFYLLYRMVGRTGFEPVTP
jgi:hypothetical protein